MRVIKRGKVYEKVYRFKCHECNSIIEVREREFINYDIRQLDKKKQLFNVQCPVCYLQTTNKLYRVLDKVINYECQTLPLST